MPHVPGRYFQDVRTAQSIVQAGDRQALTGTVACPGSRRRKNEGLSLNPGLSPQIWDPGCTQTFQGAVEEHVLVSLGQICSPWRRGVSSQQPQGLVGYLLFEEGTQGRGSQEVRSLP